MRKRRHLRGEPEVPPTDPVPSGAREVVPEDQQFALVAVDPSTGAHVDIGVRATFRDLEILGSAGRYYGEHYDNPDRPAGQVAWRRERASTVGEALWEAATDRVGVQDPVAEPD
jgi:hypothetical protein